MIWRRLQIPGCISLAELHQIIQIIFGWDNDYLHRFHIYGKDYGIAYAEASPFLIMLTWCILMILILMSVIYLFMNITFLNTGFMIFGLRQ